MAQGVGTAVDLVDFVAHLANTVPSNLHTPSGS